MAESSATGSAGSSDNDKAFLFYGISWNIADQGSRTGLDWELVRHEALKIFAKKFPDLPKLLLIQEPLPATVKRMKEIFLFEEGKSISSTKSDPPESCIAWDTQDKALLRDMTTNRIKEAIEHCFLETEYREFLDRLAVAEFKIANNFIKNCNIIVVSYHGPHRDDPKKKKKFLRNFSMKICEIAERFNADLIIIGCDTNLGASGVPRSKENTIKYVIGEKLKGPEGFRIIDSHGTDAIIINKDASSRIEVTEVPWAKLPSATMPSLINEALISLKKPPLQPPDGSNGDYKLYFDHQPLVFQVKILLDSTGTKRELQQLQRERTVKKSQKRVESVITLELMKGFDAALGDIKNANSNAIDEEFVTVTKQKIVNVKNQIRDDLRKKLLASSSPEEIFDDTTNRIHEINLNTKAASRASD